MKTRINIVPNVSINGIEFGADRADVYTALGKPKKTFKKSSDSMNTTDAYSFCHVYYTSDNKLQAIEFFEGDVEIYINNVLVFPGTIDAIKKVSPDMCGKFGSYISKESSIGVCQENGMITSFLVARKGYYASVK